MYLTSPPKNVADSFGSFAGRGRNPYVKRSAVPDGRRGRPGYELSKKAEYALMALKDLASRPEAEVRERARDRRPVRASPSS